jgi:hypothetical protein
MWQPPVHPVSPHPDISMAMQSGRVSQIRWHSTLLSGPNDWPLNALFAIPRGHPSKRNSHRAVDSVSATADPSADVSGVGLDVGVGVGGWGGFSHVLGSATWLLYTERQRLSLRIAEVLEWHRRFR